MLELGGALFPQGVHDVLVKLALRGGAEREDDGGERVHLLVLLQDLLILRTARVVLLHPARNTMPFLELCYVVLCIMLFLKLSRRVES